jgi:hypothetical protein
MGDGGLDEAARDILKDVAANLSEAKGKLLDAGWVMCDWTDFHAKLWDNRKRRAARDFVYNNQWWYKKATAIRLVDDATGAVSYRRTDTLVRPKKNDIFLKTGLSVRRRQRRCGRWRAYD